LRLRILADDKFLKKYNDSVFFEIFITSFNYRNELI